MIQDGSPDTVERNLVTNSKLPMAIILGISLAGCGPSGSQVRTRSAPADAAHSAEVTRSAGASPATVASLAVVKRPDSPGAMRASVNDPQTLLQQILQVIQQIIQLLTNSMTGSAPIPTPPV